MGTQRPGDLQILSGDQQRPARQTGPDRLDCRLRQRGQIREGFVRDLALNPIGAANQMADRLPSLPDFVR